MKWSKFKGEISGKNCYATIELNQEDVTWIAKSFRINDQAAEIETKKFEEGELDQAHEWCQNQIIQYEKYG